MTDSVEAAATTKAELNKTNEPPTNVGCGSCDLVACGYCQEGCPVSSCKYVSEPDKKDDKNKGQSRNGCKPQYHKKGQAEWPDVNKVAVNGGFPKGQDRGITNYQEVATKCRTK